MIPVLFSVYISFSIFRTPNNGMLPLIVPYWNIVAGVIAWAVFDISWSELNTVPHVGSVKKARPNKTQSIIFFAMAVGSHVLMYVTV